MEETITANLVKIKKFRKISLEVFSIKCIIILAYRFWSSRVGDEKLFALKLLIKMELIKVTAQNYMPNLAYILMTMIRTNLPPFDFLMLICADNREFIYDYRNEVKSIYSAKDTNYVCNVIRNKKWIGSVLLSKKLLCPVS